uniref:Glycerol-3-phosphate acyltransferase 3-like n=1 Tax=Sinocyclocheilus rhinocerous TaxID=307959 RepID=A0A673I8W6_9TELE
MEGFWAVFFPVLRVWFTCLVVLIMLPAMFGISLGITETYMKILLKTLEWATHRIQRASRAEEILKQSASNGEFTHIQSQTHLDPAIGLSWLVIGTTMVGFLPNFRVKGWLSELVHLMCYRICARGLSATIHYHNKQNRPKRGGICVANHTSPIDVVILANDGCYAMVGQVHGGLMGVLQRAMERSCPHIWFERAEMRDRHLVTQRLRDHVNNKTKLPILIFPEGTCINNTSVMMFKKGSFEIGGTIYPVAIKYDPQFGDAFWNSSKYSMVSYLLRMMTSWAIVCNVWYLPPMTQKEGEDAVQFANRVKSTVAQQGGLVDLAWDGGLKRAKVKDSFKEQQQKKYSHMVVGDDSSD